MTKFSIPLPALGETSFPGFLVLLPIFETLFFRVLGGGTLLGGSLGGLAFFRVLVGHTSVGRHSRQSHFFKASLIWSIWSFRSTVSRRMNFDNGSESMP